MPTIVVADENTMQRPPVAFSFNAGGVELSHKLKGLTINLPWDGQASFNATFYNYDGMLGSNPMMVTPANRLNLRHHNRFLIDQSITTNTPITNKAIVSSNISGLVRINLSSLGTQSHWMPVFLGGGWQDNCPEGSWPGYDFTYFLDVENQFMDDIVAASPPQLIHQTFKAIANRYGIQSVDMRMTDRRIGQLRRDRGRPRDWLAKLCKQSQSARRFRGQTLVAEPFKALTPGAQSSAWIFRAGVNFSSFTWKEAEPPTNNRFSVSRLQPQKGIVGRQKCTGPPCPGRTIKLGINPPSSAVRCVVQVEDGRIGDWVFVDENGIFHLGSVNGAYQGPPAVQALATYYPNFNVDVGVAGVAVVPANPGGYSILAYGGEASEVDETPFRRVFNDTTHQAAYGIWEDFTNIEDPVIFDNSGLLEYGAAILLASTRKTFTGVIKTPFVNPLMEPGHWVRLFAPRENFNDTWWFIDHIRHVMAEGGFWSSEISVSKGLW